MIKKTLSIILILICIIASSYAQEKKQAVVGFYNLENLFDTENDPLIDDEQFLPEGDYQWTPERYQHKLTNMSYVISRVAEDLGCPTLLAISEIENERVVRDLVNMPSLKPYNYGIVHHDSPDRRGVDVGLIYQKDRFQVLYSYGYPLITSDTSFRTRDQLLVKGILDGTDTLHLILNHWPSKRGGEKRSMPMRIAAAELSRHISDSIMQVNPAAKVIILGDLNDNPNAKSITQYLGAKGKIKDVGVNQLFNPMHKLYQDGVWSYVYRDEPNVIDQIIVSYGLLHPQSGYRYNSVQIFRANFLITKSGSYEGYPLRTYAAGTYMGGYSDHLPVYIILDK